MKFYTLSQQFALVGLNSLSVGQFSAAKKAVLKSIKAAELLAQYLAEPEGTADRFASVLESLQASVHKLTRPQLKNIEKETVAILGADSTLEQIPDLLNCDMFYTTAGLTLKVYRSDTQTYSGIIEGIRSEILEDGPVTSETFFLLWLFRESTILHDIFSQAEQEILCRRITDITLSDPSYQLLWDTDLGCTMAQAAVKYLHWKTKLFHNPYLEGVNLLFPFLDRRQAIFIDMVVLGTSVSDRRLATAHYLIQQSHLVDECKHGEETLLKIDNQYYRIFPKTVTCSKFPIQGISLVPFYQ